MSLECVVPHAIWHASQPLRFGPVAFTTRMTVVRLDDGSLWVHSPIAPTPELIEAVHAVGPVRYVIAPNKTHHLFFLPFMAAHASATGFIARGLAAKRSDLKGYATIPGEPPWGGQLQGYFMEGLPVLHETVFFHAPTGSLIVTDLLACFSLRHRGLTALASRLLGVRGRLGMTRTMKFATRDRQALSRSVAPLLGLPVQRVIVAHDEIVEERPVEKLTQAFAWLG